MNLFLLEENFRSRMSFFLLTTRTNSVFSTKRVNVLAFLFGVGVDDDVVARVVDVDADVHRPYQQKPDRQKHLLKKEER